MTIEQERKVERFIRKRKWRVLSRDFKTFFDNPEDRKCNGGIVYADKIIYMNRNIKRGTRKRLLVLLHEAGHMLAHRLGFALEHLPNHLRDNTMQERYAMLLGYSLAIHLKIPIRPSAWRTFNWEARLWL